MLTLYFTQLLMDWELESQVIRFKNTVSITSFSCTATCRRDRILLVSPAFSTHFLLIYLLPEVTSNLALCPSATAFATSNLPTYLSKRSLLLPRCNTTPLLCQDWVRKMHLPRKAAAVSSAVFFCSATHFHYTQTQVRINKPRESSFGRFLPHIATETIADVVTVVFKFGAHHIHIFIFFSISFSLTTYFTIFSLQKWFYFFMEQNTSTKCSVIHFCTVPSKRIEDALKKTLVGLAGVVQKYYVGSQAAS